MLTVAAVDEGGRCGGIVGDFLSVVYIYAI
jgi:hypothetical protein